MRNDNASIYRELLNGSDGVISPITKDDRTHVFQTFAVRLKNRDKICDELKTRNIGVLIHYPIPIHLQEAYSDLGHKVGDFPVSEMIANEILSLPMYPHMSKEQIEYVCNNLKELTH